MPCGLEGNRRSGVALAMRHSGLSAHGLTAQGREMSTPATLLMGYSKLYLLSKASCKLPIILRYHQDIII